MTQPIKNLPIYPKGHLLAASGIVALLSLSLLIFPSSEVEAKKTFITLDQRLSLDHDFEQTGVDRSFVSPTGSGNSPFNQAEQRTDNPLEQTSTIALNAKTATVTVVRGDTLTKIFNRADVPEATLQAVLGSSKDIGKIRIHPGQIFEFDYSSSGDLEEARSKLDHLNSISIKRTEKGYAFKKTTVEPTTRTAYSSGVIDSSLSESAQKAGLSHRLAFDMADIFAYDIDFSKLAKGDQFEVVYEEKVVEGNTVGTGKILAARFTNLRKTYTAIRYTNNSYYNAQGISLRKAFLRTPVDFARISSRFSSGRKHPILNKIRAHQGVDYAAPRGTPIKAAGDGKVLLAGRKGGYGNTVILQHGSNYKTLYAHMQGFAKGIRSGSSVRQGQIIGYIGTTGLSTGPHLHYEFQANGRHVDPLAQKGLTADPIPSRDKSKFLKLSQPLLARMDQEKNTLAMSKP